MTIKITNLRMKIQEILANADPSGFHLSEDTQIYITDEVCKLVIEEVKNALEQKESAE